MRTGRRAVRHDFGPTSRPQPALAVRTVAKRKRRLGTILMAWFTLYAAVAIVIGAPVAHADEPHYDLALVARIPSALNQQAFVDEAGHHVITMTTAADGN